MKGSLLQSLLAGGPCLAMISKMKEEMAESKTSDVIPASLRRRDSKGAFIHCCLNPNIRGTTRVSSPHRMSGCASRRTRSRVVPLRGIPPMKIRGVLRPYVNSSLPLSLVSTTRWLAGGRVVFTKHRRLRNSQFLPLDQSTL